MLPKVCTATGVGLDISDAWNRGTTPWYLGGHFLLLVVPAMGLYCVPVVTVLLSPLGVYLAWLYLEVRRNVLLGGRM